MNIKDIAQIAGVGVSTVSRVLNNHPDVSEKTRIKIMQIISENNYIPNNSARILKQNNTKNIGILVKGVYNPFFAEILKTMSTSIQEAGYTMILHYHENESDIDTLIGFVKEKKLQGAICLGGNFIDLIDDVLVDLEIPVVLVSVEAVTKKNLKNCSSVSINNKEAAYIATEHLINLGHRHIALMLGYNDDVGVGRQRTEGYLKALEEHSIPFKKEYVVYGCYECESAYTRTTQLINEFEEITSIFAISDLMAMGVAKAITDNGKSIGKQISVMGFDGMIFANYYEPSIATIKQPKAVMAKESVELLLGLLEGEEVHKHISLDVELITGDSCQSV